ncbi:mycothiol system anti-sigma-R factor [Actinomadura barringtoniae]|uniref:Mycothiol system anti-sigma-R factor n=1 Tax=Actinomadura barringtoniae TaxID=1427535 RepID=A0A939PDM4_9ACTN|nr:mycothiol system anti-sigma-R factor [Actinomadura barringtoniae]MBO2450302.1 mycothiol system anti-sigma-R factor [Actinomadura barringtoniae]
MSCGNHHETPCTEVLARVYTYLDGELDQGGCSEVREHLDECGPCLQEYGLEEAVKKLVNKSCGCEPAPGELKAKILGRIEEICGEIKAGETTGTGTSTA